MTFYQDATLSNRLDCNACGSFVMVMSALNKRSVNVTSREEYNSRWGRQNEFPSIYR